MLQQELISQDPSHPHIILYTEYAKILISPIDKEILLLLKANQPEETISLSKLIAAYSNQQDKLIKIINTQTYNKQIFTFSISLIIHLINDLPFLPIQEFQEGKEYQIGQFINRYQRTNQSSSNSILSQSCFKYNQQLAQRLFSSYISSGIDDIYSLFPQENQIQSLNISQIQVEYSDSITQYEEQNQTIKFLFDWMEIEDDIQSLKQDEDIEESDVNISSNILRHILSYEGPQIQKSENNQLISSQSDMSILNPEEKTYTKEISIQTQKTKFNNTISNKQFAQPFFQMVKKVHQKIQILSQKEQFKYIIPLKITKTYAHSFHVQMQNGKKIKNTKLTKENIVKLMYSISMGMEQLQNKNICNLDISLTNIIATFKQGKIKFYLIDFDYCFCVDCSPACQEMINIIEYFKHLDKIVANQQDFKKCIQIIFRGIKQSELNELCQRIKKRINDNLKDIWLQVICEELKQYTIKQNKINFFDICNHLILEFKNSFTEQTKIQLQSFLNKLKENKISLIKIISQFRLKFPDQTSLSQM